MKIASFNINNINRRLANLLNWLRQAEPDIVCLQETKAADTEFPAEAIRQAGYHAAWRGEKRWNGVAILARWAPVVTRVDLPGNSPYGQCRYLEAAVNGVLVASIYAPNGNPQPGPKFDYKLAWLKRLTAQTAELHATEAPVVLAGDYNVVPSFQLASPVRRSSTRREAAKLRALGRKRSGNDMALIQTKCQTSLRYAVILLTNCLAPPESAQNAPLNWCDGTATLDGVLEAGLFQTQAETLRLFRLIATMDAAAPLPSLGDQAPAWASASSLARDWELKQLADRVAGKA
jgi:exodeoxyribonuclease III